MSGNEPTRVLCECQPLPTGAAALLRLNRPDDMKPLDWQTLREMEQQLLEADADREVRVAAGDVRVGLPTRNHDLRAGRQAGSACLPP